MHLLVVAKRPLPGLAKTRLMPAFGADGAAELAAAALADTFDAVRGCLADRVLVSFEGDPTGIVPTDFEVVPQRPGSFQERLAGAWDDVGGPALQIGMDTPQLTAADLDAALLELTAPHTDAVLGPAADGGWWALGLHEPEPGLFDGVPMSQTDTGDHQRRRLTELGLATTLLPVLRDVDEPADVAIVAATAPHTRFAEVASRLLATVGEGVR
ncbi:TIGR04282 family arsenosugar biosynthesis glycosyltransferase [Aquihabitans sp. McL0605]|uniref:TIGR04282 family arsenosugar biosynthesis glycosyltransferase n=1 Tax=Aquihabitans sp. McL0605 TaxID=3415671 RepID=UPI003CECDDE1